MKFNNKLTLKIQCHRKDNDEKFIMYFSNTKYDVLYHITKFDIKTQFVHRETKMKNLFKV